MVNPIIVTAAIIRFENKILIAKRYVKESNSYKWEFPGGKLEEGEGLKKCLMREIKEELNLDIYVGDIFEAVYHSYNNKTVLILCYLCKSNTHKAQAIECADFKWVGINELKDYEYVEADTEIVKKITNIKYDIFKI